jgi:CP family cyanate transporter-like MFS transporter
VSEIGRSQRYASHALSAGFATTALIVLSLNLRPAIVSLPPLTIDIQRDLGWSNAAIGLITSIPILCMAILSPVVPRIAARWGRVPTTTGSLVLILLGSGLKLFADTMPVLLPISAVFAGLGIAIGAGLAPAFVREWFPNRIGAMTGLYSAALIFGAAIGSAASVPLMHLTGSWAEAMAFWSALAFASVLLWVVVSLRQRRHDAAQPAAPPVITKGLPWRSPLAWTLAGYLGLNAFIFYSLLAWMAPSFSERGWTQQNAGFLLALSSIAQMFGALVLPRFMNRFASRRTLFIMVMAMGIVGTIGVGFMPQIAPLVFISVQGIGLGGTFALGIALLSEYSATPADAARLTALTFLVSYILGALGPVLMGILLSAYHSWELLYGILGALLICQLLLALPLKRGLTVS